MKIAYITARVPWQYEGGMPMLTRQEIRLLAEQHAVHLICLVGDAGTTDPGFNLAGLEILSTNASPSIAGARLKAILSSHSMLRTRYGVPNDVQLVAQHLASIDPDVVIFNHLNISWLIPELPRGDAAWVHVAHNAEAEAYRSVADLQKNPLVKPLLRREAAKIEALEDKVLNRIDRCIVLTQPDADRMKHHNPELPFDVVPPAFDLPDEPAQFDGPPSHLLLVGSFRWQPKRLAAIWLANEVLTPLRRNHPDLGFQIVGADADALHESIGSVPGVSIHPNVPSVAPYLQQPCIFVVPDHQVGGIKLKTLESASFGLPIVSMPAGVDGTGLVDGETCRVATEASEFRQSIASILADPGAAARMGAGARAHIGTHFSTQSIRDRLYACVEAACAREAVGV